MMARAGPRWLLICACVGMITACQPVEGPTGDGSGEGGSGRAGLALPELLSSGQARAREWQDEPRLAQLQVELDGQGRPAAAQLDYVAADADRLLSLFAEDGQMREERVTLATLRLDPMPGTAVEEIAAFPQRALPPEQLVEAASAALEACGIAPDAVRGILYATGAPATWNAAVGEWSRPPVWRVTLLGPGASSAGVEPDTGALIEGAAC